LSAFAARPGETPDELVHVRRVPGEDAGVFGRHRARWIGQPPKYRGAADDVPFAHEAQDELRALGRHDTHLHLAALDHEQMIRRITLFEKLRPLAQREPCRSAENRRQGFAREPLKQLGLLKKSVCRVIGHWSPRLAPNNGPQRQVRANHCCSCLRKRKDDDCAALHIQPAAFSTPAESPQACGRPWCPSQ
jgi:hypothetical protein